MAGNQLLSKLKTIFNQSAPSHPEIATADSLEIKNSQSDGWHGRVHNWTNYIKDDILLVWNELPDEAKLVAAIMAQGQADNEEWE